MDGTKLFREVGLNLWVQLMVEGVDKYAYIPMTAWLCDTPMEIAKPFTNGEKAHQFYPTRNWKMEILSSIGSLPITARGKFMGR